MSQKSKGTSIAYLERVHGELETELSTLVSGKYLSARDQMHVSQIKKQKLSAKDRIARLKTQSPR